MASINLQDGEQARLTITKEQEVEISKLYRQVYLDLKKQVGSLPLQGEGTASQSLRKTYLNKLIKQLKEEYKALGEGLEKQIKKGMQDTASTVVQANADWLKKAGLTIEGAYSYVPKDIVALLSTGKLYGGGWTLSKAIWGESQKHAHDIDKIVAAGVAANKSAYEIARDLEKYVNPSAKKEWDWSKVYPGTSKKVDYNAQRLARTMVSHAYQQSLLASTKFNPFVKGYRWRSAHTHRTCEICNERDGQLYSANDLPLDHPNGMCTFIAELTGNMNSVAERLGDWANGAEDPALDKWVESMYSGKVSPMSNSQKRGSRSESSSSLSSEEVVKAKIDALPQYRESKFKQNPIPMVDRDIWFEADDQRRYREENDLGMQWIRVSDLETSQSRVSGDRLKGMIDNKIPLGTVDEDDEIEVILYDGHYILTNGNHRSSLAKLFGVDKLQVRVRRTPKD